MHYISKKWITLLFTSMVTASVTMQHDSFANPPATVPPVAFPPTPTPRPAIKPLTDKELTNYVIPSSFQKNTSSVLAIAYNGFRRSQVDPCGCVSHQLGGLDKEARALEMIKNDQISTLMVDAGGFVKDLASELEKNRTPFLLNGLHEIGYDIVNISFTDIDLGVDKLKHLGEDSKISFISANIENKSGQLIFPAYKVKDIKLGDGSDIKVGVIGLTRPRSTNPADAEGKDFKITDANAALKKVLPQVKAESDVVVVLSYDRRERAFDLIKDLENKADIDLIITGENVATYGNVQNVEGVRVVSGGYEGRQVGVLYTEIKDKKITRHDNRWIEVVQSIVPLPSITKFIEESKKAAPAPVAATPTSEKLNLE